MDFLPGGSLAVPRGDEVVAVANLLARRSTFVVATRDWHPADHCSFAANHEGGSPGQVVLVDGLQQVLWPVHCVQGSPGALFAPDLDRASVNHVVDKGVDPRVDSYSGFFDNGGRHATGLEDLLRDHAVYEVVIMGLATDYCVRFTALDALRLGFRTLVVEDGCRGVDLTAGDSERALAELARAGARIVVSDGPELSSSSSARRR